MVGHYVQFGTSYRLQKKSFEVVDVVQLLIGPTQRIDMWQILKHESKWLYLLQRGWKLWFASQCSEHCEDCERNIDMEEYSLKRNTISCGCYENSLSWTDSLGLSSVSCFRGVTGFPFEMF